MSDLRKEVEMLFLAAIHDYIPHDRQRDAIEFFAGLSDDDFTDVCHELLHLYEVPDENLCGEALLQAVHDAMLAEAFAEHPLEVLSQKEARSIWARIDRRPEPEPVELTRSEDMELLARWAAEDDIDPQIPVDLFVNGTIPIQDISIEVDETALEDGGLFAWRVLVFRDYRARMAKAGPEGTTVAVVIVPVEKVGEFFICMDYLPDNPELQVGKLGFRSAEQADQARECAEFDMSIAGKIAVLSMETWYGIEYTLLHPKDDYLTVCLQSQLDPDALEE